MLWFVEFWEEFLGWLPFLLLIFDVLLIVGCIAWVITIKNNTTSAVAWCLVIIFLPFLGALLFFFFGYQHVNRPLKRKRRHKTRYQHPSNPAKYDDSSSPDYARLFSTEAIESKEMQREMARLASRLGGFGVTSGNHVEFFHDGPPCFEAMFRDIETARHHIHMEFFIFHPDALGQRFLDVLTAKAKEGIQVRLLYDAMGSYTLRQRFLRPLREAGGQISAFLPLNPFRRRFQINMRNHRKIMVLDGAVGYVGGLNIGEEYAGKDAYYGYWRDTHLRIEGPAVWDLQRIFGEDFSFAAEISPRRLDLALATPEYFQLKREPGPYTLQVIDSGPDRDLKTIREITFAAIVRAKKRVWIASPYFVPDEGLLDALRLAATAGVDVRVLCQFKPDRWVPQYAARYYWSAVLPAGVKIYQYTKGMQHAKVMIVDDEWASVGSANLDNRSMYLNFEANCLLYSHQAVEELERAFLVDLEDAIQLDKSCFANRPLTARLLENACRLLAPVL